MPDMPRHANCRRWCRRLLIPCLFLLLVIVRACMPAPTGETYAIHDAIAESILDGNKWGLQALVKIPDAPLLPTLGLCLAKYLLPPLGLNPAAALCAFSQTLVLLMLFHAAPKKSRLDWTAFIVMLALPAFPMFRSFTVVNDPNWLSAIPLTAAILQFRLYSVSPQLKTLFNIAICLGLLVFCGPAMLLAALAMTAVAIWQTTRKDAPKGALCILLMPVLYALLLWIPWYSTSSDNIVTETLVAFQKADEHIFASPIDIRIFAALFLAVLFILPLAKAKSFCMVLMAIATLLPLSAALSNYLGLTQAGAAPAITILAALAIMATQDLNTAQPLWKILPAIPLAAMLALACTLADVKPVQRATPDIIARNTPPPPDTFNYADAPEADRLAALADEQWQGSRIVIVGKRLTSVVYPDPYQQRFRPMSDFSPEIFCEWAAAEQLHLLVPPPDGRFYDDASPLSDIHRRGAAYLFPVAQLSDGWQLWRSVPPPAPKPPTP